MIKVAINGLGRIGRPTLRRILKVHSDLELVAVNDLTDPETLTHLLKYDSLYGIYEKRVKFTKDSLLIDGTRDGRKIKVFSKKDPSDLPWEELGIDLVLECTGVFTRFEDAKKHLQAGAKKVIISANAETEKVPHFVMGVNEKSYDPEKDQVLSMGSCTTNCLAPIAQVLKQNFGIKQGFMTTAHSYTNSQRLLDAPHHDLRRARAAAVNLVPTTTGAAKAIGRVIPDLEGKLDGRALRVPTPVVSFLDLTVLLEEPASAQEINYAFKQASKKKELESILGIEDAPLVSTDYRGNSFSAIVDGGLTLAQDGLAKICAWYDNEYGYACRLAEFAEYVGSQLEN